MSTSSDQLVEFSPEQLDPLYTADPKASYTLDYIDASTGKWTFLCVLCVSLGGFVEFSYGRPAALFLTQRWSLVGWLEVRELSISSFDQSADCPAIPRPLEAVTGLDITPGLNYNLDMFHAGCPPSLSRPALLCLCLSWVIISAFFMLTTTCR